MMGHVAVTSQKHALAKTDTLTGIFNYTLDNSENVLKRRYLPLITDTHLQEVRNRTVEKRQKKTTTPFYFPPKFITMQLCLFLYFFIFTLII